MRRIAGKVMVLGADRLVGAQIVRQIARDIEPRLIVIVSSRQSDVRGHLQKLRKEFPNVTFDGAWGDIYLRSSWREKSRADILLNHKSFENLFSDLFDDPAKNARKNLMVDLIQKFKPDVIVDADKSADAFTSADLFVNSVELVHEMRSWRRNRRGKRAPGLSDAVIQKMEALIVNQPLPQLIRHIQLLHDAMVSVGTRLYLKVGTTGTGGMGLTLPYTHSEDRPSPLLMSQAAMAFAQTGLLFLMARTPRSPIVKEVKPAALVGYRKVENKMVLEEGRSVDLFHAKKVTLREKLYLHTDVGYARRGALTMVGVDMGEVGFFTLGEFQAVTSMYQMEFLTPEEIAQTVVLEINGMNTGKDVIAAIDATVMDPSYRAGLLRAPVLAELRALESETHTPSIALGQLGPPELSKLLFEAYLLKVKYPTLHSVMAADPGEISLALEHHVLHHPIRHTIISIGVPILLSDGKTLLRGPKMNIPEYRGTMELPATLDNINKWSRKGWVDLRSENMAVWRKRCAAMLQSGQNAMEQGSAAFDRTSYPAETIEIGEVVGWIFNNDTEYSGYRIKAL